MSSKMYEDFEKGQNQTFPLTIQQIYYLEKSNWAMKDFLSF